MSKKLCAMVAALAVVLPLSLSPTPLPASAATATVAAPASQARLGTRFGRRMPTSRYRHRPRTSRPYRRTYRRSPLRGFFGGVLKALGIAYLLHALFGWGGGGSPFGMLLLVAIVLWLATRASRRRAYYR